MGDLDRLFEIETDRLILRWDGLQKAASGRSTVPDEGPPGRLRVIPARKVASVTVRPAGYPQYVLGAASTGDEASIDEGPRLFEQTQYHVSVEAREQASVELRHRDPTIMRVVPRPAGREFIALVNFGSQVGFSRFSVLVDGEPELDFEIEVFPSKIDYKSDYDQMLAEVTGFLTGLALEYLRATYRPGEPVRAPRPTDVEWLTILRQVWFDLERALLRIRERPARRLVREQRSVRPERIRRIDSSVRRAALRGRGRGGRHVVPGLGVLREYVDELRPIETLDTPEHRWLRSQLQDIRYRIAELIREEVTRLGQERGRAGIRSEAALAELRLIEERVTLLLRLEPLAEATGEPPPSFSSLVLQAAPGYREAYSTCLILRLGLRLEGGPLNLSLKDIAELYEYWCYLGVLKILSEEMGTALDPKDIFRVTSRGLKVDLERGRTKQIVLQSGRTQGGNDTRAYPTRVALAYNPSYRSVTTPHRPDVGLAITVEGWEEPFEIIFDAKYRIDVSPEYRERYGSPGPPEDAVNVLHRYRDAILIPPPGDAGGAEAVNDAGGPNAHGVRGANADGTCVANAGETGGGDDGAGVILSPRRRIVLGAVLFPFQDSGGEFRRNRFWQSLSVVGIGALPFLPSQAEYVRRWLHEIFRQSGWTFADRAIEHWSIAKRARWVKEASEPALLAVLRPGVGHLEWIKQHRMYYAPLNRLGPRRFAAKWIAFYQGRRDRGAVGAITHEAPIIKIDVKPRREIVTPWPANRPGDELQIVYFLGEVREREEPIEIRQGMRDRRWSSRLSLKRAQRAEELYLETEPEWRLYDELRAKGIRFELSPGNPRVVDPDDIKGRARFHVTSPTTQVIWMIRYNGNGGFVMEGNRTVRVATVNEVLEHL